MVGIVVLNYISYMETKKCVNSIIDKTDINYKIYIVDNGSPNNSYEQLKKEFKNNKKIVLINSPINVGFSAGNNIGIKYAMDDKVENIILTNSDIIFHEKSIEKMIEFLNCNKEVGIVSPKILDKKGEIYIKSRIFKRTGIKEKIFARTKLKELDLFDIYTNYYGLNKSFKEKHEIYTASGSCMALSKEMVKLITPLDENIFLYEEELIIGIRAEKTPLKVCYLPDAVVTHFHGESSKYIGAWSLIHLVNSEIYYCKSYLNASVFEILPIYINRILFYIYMTFHHKDYRRKINIFLKETIKRILSKDGLG